MPGAAWPRRGVYKWGEAIWFVPSRSEKGAYRRVEWHHHPKTGVVFTCTCPAGQQRGQMGAAANPAKGISRPCWHVLEASRAEQEDGYPPRPKAKPSAAVLKAL